MELETKRLVRSQLARLRVEGRESSSTRNSVCEGLVLESLRN